LLPFVPELVQSAASIQHPCICPGEDRRVRRSQVVSLSVNSTLLILTTFVITITAFYFVVLLLFSLSFISVTTIIRGALQSLLGVDYVLHPHRRAHASEPGRKTQVCCPPSVVCCALFTVCCLLSAFCLLPAVCYLLSAASAPPRVYEPARTQDTGPMTICLLAAVYCLLSAVC
jgi:hypothetical protein